MTLSQIAALAADATFQGQVRAAAMRYSATALAAGATTHDASDQKKWALAASTIADGCVANQVRFAWGIASTAGFSGVLNDTTGANDTAIISTIVSQWARIAGVTAADTGG